MPTLHAKLPASATDRWSACPGSVHMDAPVRERSVYADEGTAAHALAESVMSDDDAGPIAGYLSLAIFVGPKGETRIVNEAVQPHSAGQAGDEAKFVIDHEMIEHVSVFVDFCETASITHGDGSKVTGTLLEKYVKLAGVHKSLGGTLDFAEMYANGDAILADLKYGRGVVVDVEDNLQQKVYALGLALQRPKSIKRVISYIVQPRAYHVDGPIRRAVYDADYLRGEFADWLRQRALDTEQPDALVFAGSHCRWCDAASICPVKFEQVQKAAAEEFGAVTTAMVPTEKAEVDFPAALSQAYEILPQVEAWCKNVRATALTFLSDGRDIPGYKLAAGRGTRTWNITPEELTPILRQGKLLKADCFTEKIKTPAQIEKLLAQQKGMSPKLIKMLLGDLIESTPGGPKVVPADDPAEDFRSDAAADFAT